MCGKQVTVYGLGMNCKNHRVNVFADVDVLVTYFIIKTVNRSRRNTTYDEQILEK